MVCKSEFNFVVRILVLNSVNIREWIMFLFWNVLVEYSNMVYSFEVYGRC